jgi:hypothetical protein
MYGGGNTSMAAEEPPEAPGDPRLGRRGSWFDRPSILAPDLGDDGSRGRVEAARTVRLRPISGARDEGGVWLIEPIELQKVCSRLPQGAASRAARRRSRCP